MQCLVKPASNLGVSKVVYQIKLMVPLMCLIRTGTILPQFSAKDGIRLL